MILLKEEIRRSPVSWYIWYGTYSIIYRVSYMSGGFFQISAAINSSSPLSITPSRSFAQIVRDLHSSPTGSVHLAKIKAPTSAVTEVVLKKRCLAGTEWMSMMEGVSLGGMFAEFTLCIAGWKMGAPDWVGVYPIENGDIPLLYQRVVAFGRVMVC